MTSPFRDAPPAHLVEAALAEAAKSPCAKSRRGVVAYLVQPSAAAGYREPVIGQGHNRPAAGAACDGSETCRAMCGKACVHAELAAVLSLSTPGVYDRTILIHVKLGDSGDLLRTPAVVAGGPPSCWPCANLILAAGLYGIWLYEAMWEGPRWQFWEARDFHRATLQRQPEHPSYLRRNAIEIPCGARLSSVFTGGWMRDAEDGCGAQGGARRDRKGFWRCNLCGYPAP